MKDDNKKKKKDIMIYTFMTTVYIIGLIAIFVVLIDLVNTIVDLNDNITLYLSTLSIMTTIILVWGVSVVSSATGECLATLSELMKK